MEGISDKKINETITLTGIEILLILYLWAKASSDYREVIIRTGQKQSGSGQF